MKKLILLIIIFSPISIYSQIPLNDEGKIVYQYIDSTVVLHKDEIYKKAKLAIVEIFKDANAIIQIDDKENGELVGKGSSYFYIKSYGQDIQNTLKFTISISCRENKYRIKIYDINGFSGSLEIPFSIVEYNKKYNKRAYKEMIDSIDNVLKNTLKSLKEKILKKEDKF
jgi:hypothetical protein